MNASSLPSTTLHVQHRTIAAYAELTGDFNPLHLDPAFARSTPMRGTIAHGTMSLSLIYQSLAAGLGPAALASLELDVRFVRPVRPGETVAAGGEADPSTPGKYKVWVRDAGTGEECLTGFAVIHSQGRPSGQAG